VPESLGRAAKSLIAAMVFSPATSISLRDDGAIGLGTSACC
jgi:hypothetical protein